MSASLFVSESVSGTEVKRTLGPATLEIRRPTVAGQPPITPFPIYLDANAALAESLRPALLGGELHLPMTLLVDSEFVIRYAMVGGISARRSELSSAIADLLRQAPASATRARRCWKAKGPAQRRSSVRRRPSGTRRRRPAHAPRPSLRSLALLSLSLLTLPACPPPQIAPSTHGPPLYFWGIRRDCKRDALLSAAVEKRLGQLGNETRRVWPVPALENARPALAAQEYALLRDQNGILVGGHVEERSLGREAPITLMRLWRVDLATHKLTYRDHFCRACELRSDPRHPGRLPG